MIAFLDRFRKHGNPDHLIYIAIESSMPHEREREREMPTKDYTAILRDYYNTSMIIHKNDPEIYL